MVRHHHPHDAGWHFRRDLKGVVFDFDGTLTRPGTLDFPAIKQELGCPREEPILEFIQRHPEEARAALLSMLDEHEMRAAALARPNRGAEKCLRTLKRHGVRFGILTRNSLQSVSTSLRVFRRINAEDFAAIVTREDSLPKPHPDGVWTAARAMGTPPEWLLVVGDYRFDIIAGKKAGAKTALLTNGKASPMEAGDPCPDYVCGSFDDVLEILCA